MNATAIPPSTSAAAVRAATFVRRLALLGSLLALTVVVLGAWVRLTDAGLGCPDWPTCYGHVTPDAAAAIPGQVEKYDPGWEFDSGKAWHEMIHRYAATTLGFVIVLIAALAIAWRRERIVSLPFAAALLATVLLQGLLGALTVWWLVKPVIVVLHLIGGLSIGRSKDADVQIADRYASSIHVRVFERGGRFYVEDMNSTNGTLLNGATLNGEAEIIDGDTVQIGDTQFRLEVS